MTACVRTRLAQHNRGATGATRRHRPWRLLLVVSGFASRLDAVRFEHLWTHPTAGAAEDAGARGRSLRARLRQLARLLRTPLFARLPLVVTREDP